MTDNHSFLPLIADIDGLSIFSSIQKSLLVQNFRNILQILCEDEKSSSVDYALQLNRAWSCFTQSFVSYIGEKSFSEKIACMTMKDDNVFTRSAEKYPMQEINPLVCAFAKTDLMRLGRIAAANIPDIGFNIAKKLEAFGLSNAARAIEDECRFVCFDEKNDASMFSFHFAWENSIENFAEYIHKTGAGEYGQYQSFCWNSEKKYFLPVINQDTIRLNDLCGYEDQRNVVISNTLRFLDGKPANNLLLYGDRGTGKSATVKAVCNEYAHRGLRLLEIKKKDLFDLPEIMEKLSDRALRFLLFIDDLSFEETDGSFTALKAFLEGGVESRPEHVVVYATSNRRHLVKERIEDRPSSSAASSGDIRSFDTMQEQFSLADRFGVTVIFTAPNQDDFLSIAEHLAWERNLLDSSLENDDNARKVFRDNALRWERWFNGRSPRTAVQYVDWLEGGDKFPWE